METFYENKCIFLTGGTGFLGKTLLLKLLCSCPESTQIYLLVRDKKGCTANERLKQLFADNVFSRVKKKSPQFLLRIRLIEGDLHKPKLGISEENAALLAQQVDIVLHCAATVKFDEELKLAIKTNIVGTKELCLLAQEMVDLKAFVYVSTAYSNCEKSPILEKVSPSPMCPEKLVGLIDVLEESLLDQISSSLLGPKPNTYVLTKCAAENVIQKFRSSLPVAIMRPSIVIGAVSEPEPGWVEGANGASGVVSAVTSGFMKVMICDPSAHANLVPVDYAANATLALAYSVATNCWTYNNEEELVPVVNFVSLASNSLTWEVFRELLVKNVKKYPSQYLFWYPFLKVANNQLNYMLNSCFLHHVPAKILDFILLLFGGHTRFSKMYHRMEKYVKCIEYFATRHFIFEERNAQILWKSLEPRDKEVFPFNMAAIHWEEFFPNYVQGCRHYILKENPTTLPSAQRKLKFLSLLHHGVKISFILLLTYNMYSFARCNKLPIS